MIVLLAVLVLALIGTPVFVVMAAATELAWFGHENSALHHVRFLAPDVLSEGFAGSPVLVTVPLFTFIGYMMAEARTPERLVRASNAFLGWMPGGLAIVCIVASAFFTAVTGGSAVTIVAIGALLYPALLQKGYPKEYALGLVMTGGSLGLLLPPSLPMVVYSMVAGIDLFKTWTAGLLPGLVIMLLLGAQAVYVSVKAKIPRTAPIPAEMGSSLWELKWELGIPLLIIGGLFSGLTELDESAALAALYVFVIEVFVYRDLTLKDFPRIVRNSMALAGAVVLIMAMAVSLTNFIVTERIPDQLFAFVTGLGVEEAWQFLIVLNIFLYVQGMLMDGFSSILVAVPLLIPFAARFGLSPFHLAMMFLLNLEIAYLSPPLGQNLFVTSFRFNKPMAQLYRIALPFLGILVVGLLLIMTIPKISTWLIEDDIAEARATAAKFDSPPREAWMLECVQEDRNNPLPCSEEDQARYGTDGTSTPGGDAPAIDFDAVPEGGASDARPSEGAAGADGFGDAELEALFAEDGDPPADTPKEADEPKEKAPVDGDQEDLLKEMLAD